MSSSSRQRTDEVTPSTKDVLFVCQQEHDVYTDWTGNVKYAALLRNPPPGAAESPNVAATRIVNVVLNRGGRFLQEDASGAALVWKEMSFQSAVERVMQDIDRQQETEEPAAAAAPPSEDSSTRRKKKEKEPAAASMPPPPSRKAPPKKAAPTETALRAKDVIMGKGWRHFAGNEEFATIVEQYRARYQAARKPDKADIATRVVHAVQKSGGRFMKESDDVVGEYEEVDMETAINRAAYELRRDASSAAKEAAEEAAVPSQHSTGPTEKRSSAAAKSGVPSIPARASFRTKDRSASSNPRRASSIAKGRPRCDMCWTLDGFNDMTLLTCSDCGVQVHDACYGITEDQEDSESFRCWACQAVGTKLTCRDYKGQLHEITQTDRPTECCLCSVNDRRYMRPMHALYDGHGKINGLPIALVATKGKTAPAQPVRAAWVHTLCALGICTHAHTKGCVYGCFEDGSFLEPDEGSDNEDEDEDRGPIHHFAYCTPRHGEEDSKRVELIQQHQQELKCSFCGTNDKSSSVYRIPIQCCAGDPTEFDEFQDCHEELKKSSLPTCTVAFHVGCAMWAKNDHGEYAPARRVYFFPGSEEGRFANAESNFFCDAHARDIKQAKVKGSQLRYFVPFPSRSTSTTAATIAPSQRKEKSLEAPIRRKAEQNRTVLDSQQPVQRSRSSKLSNKPPPPTKIERTASGGQRSPVSASKRRLTAVMNGQPLPKMAKLDKQQSAGTGRQTSVTKASSAGSPAATVKSGTLSSDMFRDLVQTLRQCSNDSGRRLTLNARLKHWKRQCAYLSSDEFQAVWQKAEKQASEHLGIQLVHPVPKAGSLLAAKGTSTAADSAATNPAIDPSSRTALGDFATKYVVGIHETHQRKFCLEMINDVVSEINKLRKKDPSVSSTNDEVMAPLRKRWKKHSLDKHRWAISASEFKDMWNDRVKKAVVEQCEREPRAAAEAEDRPATEGSQNERDRISGSEVNGATRNPLFPAKNGVASKSPDTDKRKEANGSNGRTPESSAELSSVGDAKLKDKRVARPIKAARPAVTVKNRSDQPASRAPGRSTDASTRSTKAEASTKGRERPRPKRQMSMISESKVNCDEDQKEKWYHEMVNGVQKEASERGVSCESLLDVHKEEWRSKLHIPSFTFRSLWRKVEEKITSGRESPKPTGADWSFLVAGRNYKPGNRNLFSGSAKGGWDSYERL